MRKQHFRVVLNYQLRFINAFHCGTGLSNGLIDRSVSKDKDGYLYVPGSTIKGVLRENCEIIARLFDIPARQPHDESDALKAYNKADIDIVESIFGSRFKESTLFFDNAYMINKEFFDSQTINQKYLFMQVENRTQTSISRKTGTAKEGALYSSEFGISGLSFSGSIYGTLEGFLNELSEEDLNSPYALFLLIAGINLTEKIGANRTNGMGRCKFLIENLLVDVMKKYQRII
jgi:CRISPR/Cas system CSM-associated protein Csm3 (group 7 of RAMP superfamily)